VVTDKGDLFDDLAPNGIGKKIRFEAQYTDSDHFVIDTELGEIRVEKIVFWGELSLREELVPLADTAEYRQMETGETISQVASFAPQSIHGVSYSLEFHRIAGTGETSVILRKLLDKT
jgi:hypothetical protein